MVLWVLLPLCASDPAHLRKWASAPCTYSTVLCFVLHTSFITVQYTSEYELPTIRSHLPVYLLFSFFFFFYNISYFSYRIEVREVGGRKVIVFSQQQDEDTTVATIIIRASTEHVLNDVEVRTPTPHICRVLVVYINCMSPHSLKLSVRIILFITPPLSHTELRSLLTLPPSPLSLTSPSLTSLSLQRAVDDGVNSVRVLCTDKRLLPGAGAVELELCKRCVVLVHSFRSVACGR